jgi:hypothetical protein
VVRLRTVYRPPGLERREKVKRAGAIKTARKMTGLKPVATKARENAAEIDA